MTESDKNNEAQKAPLDLTSLGSYSINSRLGQGGMGIVYLGEDNNLGRPVAIKVLHPHLLKHENLKQRFRREARMHAKLMHPNIVTLLSLYEDETYMALVMEVVTGDDLKAYLRKNTQLTIKKKLSIAVEILKGLEAAHEFGMVHRDLKPANVLISNKGEVKLLDFGLAKPEHGGEDLTQSGATVGSFRYMAPEQILNNPLDARTDLYAFGILLFYMLLGKLPFDATGSGGEFEIMEKQVREPAPRPHDIDASIPHPLSKLILKLLEKNKQHRPESAKDVRLEIELMLEQMQLLKAPEKKKEKYAVKSEVVPDHSSLSKHQIAKQWFSYGRFHWQKILVKMIPNIKKKHTDLVMMAFVFIALGASSIVILSMSEKTFEYSEDVKHDVLDVSPKGGQHIASVNKNSAPPIVTLQNTQSTQSKPLDALVAKEETKLATLQPKRNTEKTLTDLVKYRLKHKGEKSISPKKKNEFRGGSHTFFPELVKKSWFSPFKKSYTSVLFDRPVSLSKVIIHKASVRENNFQHGFIQVEVRPEGQKKWRKIFERKDKDIKHKISIKNNQPLIDAVRLTFKTQYPITIGPIDLYK